MTFTRADFAPLRDTGYGIGFHWTTWTLPRDGETVKPFEQAVDDFDVDAFVAQAVEAGAGHVLFTATHALHWLPAPHPEVDRILPGRTCRRDLIGEIADGLAAQGIKLVLYYHHGTDGPAQDPEWQEAVGSLDADQTALLRQLLPHRRRGSANATARRSRPTGSTPAMRWSGAARCPGSGWRRRPAPDIRAA